MEDAGFLTSLKNLGQEFLNAGVITSLVTAALVATSRALARSEPFSVAFINLILSGFAAPSIVWFFWKSAPFFVYGAISAACAMYLGDFLNSFFKKLPDHLAKRVSGSNSSSVYTDSSEGDPK